jgi:hypothetical protein
MWLYPLPPLVAMAGFLYILVERPHFLREVSLAGAVIVTGSVVFVLRQRFRRTERV